MSEALRDALARPPASSTVERDRVHARVFGAMFRRFLDPVVVGRYRIRTRLGGGGQGDVYDAYDPTLDRAVALKVLRQGTAHGEREAKALGMLDHPNVVQVFGVGQHADAGGEVRSYIVTERVDGETLDRWLDRVPSREAKLQLLAGCAKGLLAAHEAGLVHADFKPSNVLVTAAGVPRIIDFGIAARQGEARAEEGTRGYIAPERSAGAEAAPAIDQFGLCVVACSMLEHEAISRRLRRVLARGCEPDPKRRHASLAPIVSALERELEPPSAVVWWATGAAVAAIGFAVATAEPSEVDDCGASDSVARARAAVNGRLPSADRWLDRWADTREQACLGSGPRSAAVACLDDALATFEAYATSLDDDGVRTALARLESPDGCMQQGRHLPAEASADLREGGLALARGAAAEALARSDRWVHRLDSVPDDAAAQLLFLRGRALHQLGRNDDALAAMEAALWRAEAGDERPLSVEISAELVLRYGQRGDLSTARRWLTWARERARSVDENAAVAGVHAFVLTREGRPEDAVDLALLAAETAQGERRASVLRRACVASDRAGGTAETVDICRRAVEAYEAELGADHPSTLTVRQSFGAALEGAGRYVEARAELEAVLEAQRSDEQRVDRTLTLNSLGIVCEQLDDFDTATEAYREALATIREGPERRPDIEEHLNVNLGTLAIQRGHPEDALGFYERARISIEERLGDDAPQLVWVRWGLGSAYNAMQRYAEARDTLLLALERATALSMDSVTHAKMETELATAYVRGGLDLDAGRRSAERAIALFLEHAPDSTQQIADARSLLEEAAQQRNEAQ